MTSCRYVNIFNVKLKIGILTSSGTSFLQCVHTKSSWKEKTIYVLNSMYLLTVLLCREKNKTFIFLFLYFQSFYAPLCTYIENTENKKKTYYKEKKMLQTNSKFSVTCL